MRDAGDGVYECEYVPRVPGTYQVSITWGGYAIPRRSVALQGSRQGEGRGVGLWGRGGGGMMYKPHPSLPLHPPQPI